MEPKSALGETIAVAIADDDVEMLKLLNTLADWAALGVAILARGTDGGDVLRQLEGRPVDLLLSDITMPGMDGYALAEALRARNPALQVIFFTCHEDFDHAQRAIRAGAEDYLVKYTLTRATLEASLRKAIDVIRTIRGDRRRIQAFDRSLLGARESFIYEIVRTARDDPESLEEKLALYKMRISGRFFCLLALYPQGGGAKGGQESDGSAWRYEVAELVQDAFRAEGIADELFLYQQQVMILHSWNEAPAFDEKYTQALRRCFALINETMRQPVAVTRSITCRRAAEIKQAVVSIGARRLAQFYQEDSDFLSEEVPRRDYVELSDDTFEAMLTRLRISIRQRTDFLQTLDAIAEELLSRQAAPTSVYRLFEAVASAMQTTHAQPPLRLEGVSFGACLNTLEARFEQYNEACGAAMPQTEHQDVRRVIRYVEKNLGGDLGLQTVARKVCISTGYLSRLFKQQTGVSYSDFLIKRRIDRATQLLEETAMPMEEVAASIGIENISYFFRFYKRETGKTPGSIRRGIG